MQVKMMRLFGVVLAVVVEVVVEAGRTITRRWGGGKGEGYCHSL